MASDLRFKVVEDLSDRTSGSDTSIFVMPSSMYNKDGALLVGEFVKMCRSIFGIQADNLGEELHSADIIVTSDPDSVRKYGTVHDCDTCREGTARALEYLEQHPDAEIVVALLKWVDSDSAP